MFHEIVVILHIFLCVGLIGLILIQHGKGADAGAAFGSGASATVFGSQGSGSFLTRTTAILATTFFITSLTLAYFSIQRIEKPESVLDKVPPSTTSTSEVPAVPSEGGGDLPPATGTTNEVPAIDDSN